MCGGDRLRYSLLQYLLDWELYEDREYALVLLVRHRLDIGRRRRDGAKSSGEDRLSCRRRIDDVRLHRIV